MAKTDTTVLPALASQEFKLSGQPGCPALKSKKKAK